uniref:CD9 antigen-like n=1 Tax=Myxine glutinosa TaxID=7769 RepID=UPI00358FAD1C
MAQEHFGYSTLKPLMIFCLMLFWVFGAATLVSPLWTRFDLTVAELFDYSASSVVTMGGTVGGVMAISLAVLGCSGAQMESPSILILLLLGLLSMLVMEVLVSSWCFITRDKKCVFTLLNYVASHKEEVLALLAVGHLLMLIVAVVGVLLLCALFHPVGYIDEEDTAITLLSVRHGVENSEADDEDSKSQAEISNDADDTSGGIYEADLFCNNSG